MKSLKVIKKTLRNPGFLAMIDNKEKAKTEFIT
jgi:hypothetical protein